MRALEDHLQLTLFDRSKRSPALTPLGRAVAAKAREVVESYDRLVPSVLAEEGFAGELALGAVPTCLSGLIPLTVSRLKQGYPNLHISVQPGLTRDLISNLRRGTIDAAVASRPAAIPAGVAFHFLAEERLQLLVAEGRRNKLGRRHPENPPFHPVQPGHRGRRSD